MASLGGWRKKQILAGIISVRGFPETRSSHTGVWWRGFEAVMVWRAVGLDIPESSYLTCPSHLHIRNLKIVV